MQAVLDHLETIVDDASGVTMVAGQPRPFEPGTSRVALAGYSMGAITTLAAAGQIVRGSEPDGPVMDLTTHGLRRVNDNVTPGDVTDDSGPFVDVDAFLAMSLGGYAGSDELFVLNPSKPAVTGRDYIQRPLMMTTGSQDLLTTTSGSGFADASNAAFYYPVTEAAGINDAPAYGLVIDQGNHITPLVVFDNPRVPVLAWKPDPNTPAPTLGWSYFTPFLWKEQLSAQQSDDLDVGGALHDIVMEWVENMVGTALSITVIKDTARNQMGKGLLPYTLAFWDAYLGRTYDDVPASTLLDRSPKTQREDVNYMVADIQQSSGEKFGYALSLPTQSWTINDSGGNPVVQFTSDGDLLLYEGTFSQPGPIITVSANPEVVVKNGLGTILMLVDGINGNVKMSSLCSLSEEVFDLQASNTVPELVIHSATDQLPDAQVVLRGTGALKLRGAKFQSPLDILVP